MQKRKVSFGAIAQLGEHLLCKQGVTSSSLVSSTKESPIAAIRAGCKPAAFRLRRFESYLSYQSVSEQALKVTKTIGTRFAEHPERELRHQHLCDPYGLREVETTRLTLIIRPFSIVG